MRKSKKQQLTWKKHQRWDSYCGNACTHEKQPGTLETLYEGAFGSLRRGTRSKVRIHQTLLVGMKNGIWNLTEWNRR